MLVRRWLVAAATAVALPAVALVILQWVVEPDLGPRALTSQRTLIGIAAAVPLGILLVTAAMALASRGSYARTALLFRPGMLLLLVGLAVLLPLQLVLVTGVVVGPLNAAGILVLPVFLVAASGGVTIAVAGVLVAAVAMLRAPVVRIPGLALARTSAPALFAEVDGIARALDTQPPETIVVSLEPRFFVTEVVVDGFDGRHRGRTLVLSPALARLLTLSEFRAALGHEMGHFRAGEARYSGRVGPGFVAALRAFDALGATSGTVASVGAQAAAHLLGAYFVTFASGHARLSRERELEADRAGASVASAEALVSGLAKVRAAAGGWDPVFADALEATHAGRGLRRLVAAAIANHRDVAGRWRPASGAEIAHPFDVHPALHERAAALGVEESVLARAVAELDPPDHAAALFGDLEALDDLLTSGLEVTLRDRLGVPATVSGFDDRTLRAAGAADATLGALLAIVEEAHGDLARPPRRPGRWVALTDLDVQVHPTAVMSDAAITVDIALPDGQHLAVGLAGAGTETAIPRGATLHAIGYNVPRTVAVAEDLFLVREGLGMRVVALRGPGGVPVAHQLAGLMVVPESDPLADRDGPFGERLASAVGAYLAAAPR